LGQNDEIERLGIERSGLYRKCRLEEIKLPLVAGNLKNVPMEEVRRRRFSLSFSAFKPLDGRIYVKRWRWTWMKRKRVKRHSVSRRCLIMVLRWTLTSSVRMSER
jgi:hypothetical protein